MLLMPHVLISRHPKPTILGSLDLSPIIDYNKLSLSVNDRLNVKKKTLKGIVVGGIGCLELCLYGKRDQHQQPIRVSWKEEAWYQCYKRRGEKRQAAFNTLFVSQICLARLPCFHSSLMLKLLNEMKYDIKYYFLKGKYLDEIRQIFTIKW